MLNNEQKKKGVISASLGNHAQGLSYHAQKLGIPCTVVMPNAAPIMKIQKCRNYGAAVLVHVSRKRPSGEEHFNKSLIVLPGE